MVPMPNGPQAADPVAPESNPEVMAHVQRSGDLTCMLGDWLGIKGSRQWIEGFGLAPANGISLQDIEYQAVLGRNWLSPWVEGGKFCGSRGMALPLLGLKVRLKGAAAKAFECTYSAIPDRASAARRPVGSAGREDRRQGGIREHYTFEGRGCKGGRRPVTCREAKVRQGSDRVQNRDQTSGDEVVPRSAGCEKPVSLRVG